MTKRFGFTLAEVLITLGIIGVVAAMTIPTLISNTNGAQFKTAYKKALSTLNQAVLMNVAMEDTDFSSMVADTAGDGTVSNSVSKLLKSRLQTSEPFTYDAEVSLNANSPIKDLKAVDGAATVWSHRFSDNTSFSFAKAAASCNETTKCLGFIDVNGNLGPNKEVECTNTALTGKVDSDGTNTCEVASTGVQDIYPVYFYGQTIEPATDAARAVLFGK